MTVCRRLLTAVLTPIVGISCKEINDFRRLKVLRRNIQPPPFRSIAQRSAAVPVWSFRPSSRGDPLSRSARNEHPSRCETRGKTWMAGTGLSSGGPLADRGPDMTTGLCSSSEVQSFRALVLRFRCEREPTQRDQGSVANRHACAPGYSARGSCHHTRIGWHWRMVGP
jgi:hypothetical protein